MLTLQMNRNPRSFGLGTALFPIDSILQIRVHFWRDMSLSWVSKGFNIRDSGCPRSPQSEHPDAPSAAGSARNQPARRTALVEPHRRAVSPSGSFDGSRGIPNSRRRATQATPAADCADATPSCVQLPILVTVSASDGHCRVQRGHAQ